LIEKKAQTEGMMSGFKHFQLADSIIEQIKHRGYTEPTSIQQECIPLLMQGHDLLGIAQTGTGKTAAFSLHMIDKFIKNKIDLNPKSSRALILAPTRELASQIFESIEYYATGTNLKITVAYGGIKKQDQVDALKSGLDILVATPGRLLDLVLSDEIKFSQLEIFILDEADSMMDLGFSKTVEKIIQKLPINRQTLLFSATMPNEIEQLSKEIQRDPRRVEISSNSETANAVTQSICLLAKSNKMLLLLSILENTDYKSVLIFCKTKIGSDIVAQNLLEAEIQALSFHSNKHQRERERVLQEFKDSNIRVLVATDVAARGIDIEDINLVINFNLPDDPRNYIHRVGRTARAGRKGEAISFVVENDVELINSIQESIQQKIPINSNKKFHKEFSLVIKKPKVKNKTKKGKKKK